MSEHEPRPDEQERLPRRQLQVVEFDYRTPVADTIAAAERALDQGSPAVLLGRTSSWRGPTRTQYAERVARVIARVGGETRPYPTALEQRPHVAGAYHAPTVVLGPSEAAPQASSVRDAACEAYCDLLARRQQGRWLIVGDESGTHGGADLLGVLILLAPGHGLPPRPLFHANQRSNRPRRALVRALLGAMARDKAWLLTLDAGGAAQAGQVPRKGADEHFHLWETALPLALDQVARMKPEGATVDVHIEEACALEAGEGALARIAGVAAHLFSGEPGWGHLKVDRAQVVAKGEHGLVPYADAAAHLLTTRWSRPLATELREAPNHLPLWWGESLTDVRRILPLADRPREFLEATSALSEDSVFRYGRLLSPHVHAAVDAIEDHVSLAELARDLTGELADAPGRQVATHLVLGQVDPSRVVEHLEPDASAAVLNAVLNAANQQGDVARADEAERLWGEMVGPGTLSRHSRHEYDLHAALRANSLVNRFAFDEALQLIDEALSTPVDPRWQPHVQGTRLQLLGYLGRRDTWDAALSEYLAVCPPSDDRDRRVATYHAHAALDAGDTATALEALHRAAGATSLDMLATESRFVRWALLRAAVALGPEHDRLPWQPLVPADDPPVLPRHHPYESIAFLAARAWLLAERGEAAQGYADQLVGMCDGATDKDVLGVKRALFRMDLAARGVAELGPAQAYLDAVRRRSHPSTRAWLDAHSPGASSPLGPLTFMNL